MKLPTQVEPKRNADVLEPYDIIEKRATGEITATQGLQLFQVFLKKKFPLERVATLIDDLSKATDVRMNNFGAKFSSPNWLARDKAIDKVLKIMALTQDTGPTGRMAPTKMTFNIISNSPVKIEQKIDESKIKKSKEESEGV